MATKYFCDRCDTETKVEKELDKIVLTRSLGVTSVDTKHDLCKDCGNQFISDFMNPPRASND